jgi:hypothetical protein
VERSEVRRIFYQNEGAPILTAPSPALDAKHCISPDETIWPKATSLAGKIAYISSKETIYQRDNSYEN